MMFAEICPRNSPSECNYQVSDTLFALPGLPTLHKDKPQAVFDSQSSQNCVQRPLATEPTPIKLHTRAEKRKQVQRGRRKLAASVSEFKALVSSWNEPFLRYGLDSVPL